MAKGIVRARDRVAVWREAAEGDGYTDPFNEPELPAEAPPQGAPTPVPNSNKFKTPANGLKKLLEQHTAPDDPGIPTEPHQSFPLKEWTNNKPDFTKTYFKPGYQDALKTHLGDDNYNKLLHHMPEEHHKALTTHEQAPAPKSNKFTTPANGLKKLLDSPHTETTHVSDWLSKHPGFEKTYMSPKYQDALKGHLGEKKYHELQEHLKAAQQPAQGQQSPKQPPAIALKPGQEGMLQAWMKENPDWKPSTKKWVGEGPEPGKDEVEPADLGYGDEAYTSDEDSDDPEIKAIQQHMEPAGLAPEDDPWHVPEKSQQGLGDKMLAVGIPLTTHGGGTLHQWNKLTAEEAQAGYKNMDPETQKKLKPILEDHFGDKDEIDNIKGQQPQKSFGEVTHELFKDLPLKQTAEHLDSLTPQQQQTMLEKTYSSKPEHFEALNQLHNQFFGGDVQKHDPLKHIPDNIKNSPWLIEHKEKEGYQDVGYHHNNWLQQLDKDEIEGFNNDENGDQVESNFEDYLQNQGAWPEDEDEYQDDENDDPEYDEESEDYDPYTNPDYDDDEVDDTSDLPHGFLDDWKKAFPNSTYVDHSTSAQDVKKDLEDTINEPEEEGLGDPEAYADGEYRTYYDHWMQEKLKAQQLHDKYFGDGDDQQYNIPDDHPGFKDKTFLEWYQDNVNADDDAWDDESPQAKKNFYQKYLETPDDIKQHYQDMANDKVKNNGSIDYDLMNIPQVMDLHGDTKQHVQNWLQGSNGKAWASAYLNPHQHQKEWGKHDWADDFISHLPDEHKATLGGSLGQKMMAINPNISAQVFDKQSPEGQKDILQNVWAKDPQWGPQFQQLYDDHFGQEKQHPLQSGLVQFAKDNAWSSDEIAELQSPEFTQWAAQQPQHVQDNGILSPTATFLQFKDDQKKQQPQGNTALQIAKGIQALDPKTFDDNWVNNWAEMHADAPEMQKKTLEDLIKGGWSNEETEGYQALLDKHFGDDNNQGGLADVINKYFPGGEAAKGWLKENNPQQAIADHIEYLKGKGPGHAHTVEKFQKIYDEAFGGGQQGYPDPDEQPFDQQQSLVEGLQSIFPNAKVPFHQQSTPELKHELEQFIEHLSETPGHADNLAKLKALYDQHFGDGDIEAIKSQMSDIEKQISDIYDAGKAGIEPWDGHKKEWVNSVLQQSDPLEYVKQGYPTWVKKWQQSGGQQQSGQPDLQAMALDLADAFGGTAAATWMMKPEKIPAYLNGVALGGGPTGAKAKALQEKYYGQGDQKQSGPQPFNANSISQEFNDVYGGNASYMANKIAQGSPEEVEQILKQKIDEWSSNSDKPEIATKLQVIYDKYFGQGLPEQPAKEIPQSHVNHAQILDAYGEPNEDFMQWFAKDNGWKWGQNPGQDKDLLTMLHDPENHWTQQKVNKYLKDQDDDLGDLDWDKEKDDHEINQIKQQQGHTPESMASALLDNNIFSSADSEFVEKWQNKSPEKAKSDMATLASGKSITDPGQKLSPDLTAKWKKAYDQLYGGGEQGEPQQPAPKLKKNGVPTIAQLKAWGIDPEIAKTISGFPPKKFQAILQDAQKVGDEATTEWASIVKGMGGGQQQSAPAKKEITQDLVEQMLQDAPNSEYGAGSTPGFLSDNSSLDLNKPENLKKHLESLVKDDPDFHHEAKWVLDQLWGDGAEGKQTAKFDLQSNGVPTAKQLKSWGVDDDVAEYISKDNYTNFKKSFDHVKSNPDDFVSSGGNWGKIYNALKDHDWPLTGDGGSSGGPKNFDAQEFANELGGIHGIPGDTVKSDTGKLLKDLSPEEAKKELESYLNFADDPEDFWGKDDHAAHQKMYEKYFGGDSGDDGQFSSPLLDKTKVPTIEQFKALPGLQNIGDMELDGYVNQGAEKFWSNYDYVKEKLKEPGNHYENMLWGKIVKGIEATGGASADDGPPEWNSQSFADQYKEILPGSSSSLASGSASVEKVKEKLESLINNNPGTEKTQKLQELHDQWFGKGMPSTPGGSSSAPSYQPPVSGTKHYQDLMKKVQKQNKGGAYSQADLKKFQSQEFKDWFDAAPAAYKETFKHNPGIAIDDFDAGSYGSPAQGGDWEDQKISVPKEFDPYHKGLGKGQKQQIPGMGESEQGNYHWPGWTENPYPSNGNHGRPQEFNPEIDVDPDNPNQLEIPLPAGQKWNAHGAQPLYRAFTIHLKGEKAPKKGTKADQIVQKIRKILEGSAEGETDTPTFEDMQRDETDRGWGGEGVPSKAVSGTYNHPDLAPLVLEYAALSQKDGGKAEPGLGIHWTTNQAKGYNVPGSVSLNSHEHADEHKLPVTLSAEWAGAGEDPSRSGGASGYPNEEEITLAPGAPVQINRVELRHRDHQKFVDIMKHDGKGLTPDLVKRYFPNATLDEVKQWIGTQADKQKHLQKQIQLLKKNKMHDKAEKLQQVHNEAFGNGDEFLKPHVRHAMVGSREMEASIIRIMQLEESMS